MNKKVSKVKKCQTKKCNTSCSKKPAKRSVKKIISNEPLVYIEPIVPQDTIWTKILKFFRLK